jgi:hypothetical protein
MEWEALEVLDQAHTYGVQDTLRHDGGQIDRPSGQDLGANGGSQVQRPEREQPIGLPDRQMIIDNSLDQQRWNQLERLGQ